MSAHPTGPRSTIVPAPAFHVACIFDKDVVPFAEKYGVYSENVAAVRTSSMSEMSWNIYHGDIVAYLSQKFLKNNNGRGHNGGHKGRTPVIGQVAGVPFQITKDPVNAVTEEEATEIRNQQLLKQLSFYGVSQTSYHHESGDSQSAITDGLQVLIWGPCTVRLPMSKPIPPMTDVVLAIDPSGGTSPYERVQSLVTADRTPLTIRAFEAKGPVFMARIAVKSYIDKYVQSPPKNATWNPYSVHKTSSNGSAVYSEEDASGAAFTVAVLSAGLAMVDILIRKSFLTFDKSGTTNPAAEAEAKEWRTNMPSILGLTGASDTEKKKLVEAIVNSALLGNLPDKTDAGADTAFRSLSKSAMPLLASSMGDILNQQFRIIGKNIQQNHGKASRIPSGFVETDVIWH